MSNPDLERCVHINCANYCKHKIHNYGKLKMKCVKKGCPYYKRIGGEE